MLSIHLHQLLFHAYHGVHDEEKLLGGQFRVDVSVHYQPASLPIRKLEETVNYVSIYALIKDKMARATPLLETFVTDLAQEILSTFPMVEEAVVSITKLNPPITAMQGSVGVSFALKRTS